MSLASKLSAGLFAAAFVCSLTAAEVITLVEPVDFLTPKRVALSDEGLVVKGAAFNLFSAKPLKLNPAKKYKVSGDFRMKEGDEGGVLYVGLAPLDAQGKQISSGTVNVTPKSDTVLAKAAAAGDKVVYVKDASKWDKKTPHGYFVFNTKPDYSDLPNTNIVKTLPQGGIEQEGDLWKITLKDPLKKDLAEGIGVRQQKAGAAYIYTGFKRGLTQDWTTISGVVAGSVAKSGNPSKELWPTTDSVRVLIMMQEGKKGAVVEMKNISVVEVD